MTTPSQLLQRVRNNEDYMAMQARMTAKEHENISKLSREIRIRRGVLLRKLAERMGISAVYLSDLERGNRYWTSRNIAKWVKSLKI